MSVDETSTNQPVSLPVIVPSQPFTRSFYYDSNQLRYMTQNAHGGWIPIKEKDMERYLCKAGVCHENKPGTLSQFDLATMIIQTRWDVVYAGPLAGYMAGKYDLGGGKNMLVTTSPNLIEPVSGAWPILDSLLSQMFWHDGFDQRSYLFGWLKIAIEALRAGKRRPGQVLVLAGPANSYKSVLQNLITLLLGGDGRVGKPYQYMVGKTSFNSDLFEAEHLMIEDEMTHPNLQARREFGASIKNLTVNDEQRCHAKHRHPIMLKPFWRVTISTNDEPENLMVLPPLDESLQDKLILLKVNKPTPPMPTQTLVERKLFWDALIAELPHFMHMLLTWDIPDGLLCSRYGIKHYHHPDLLAALDDLSPEKRLMGIVDRVIFSSFDPQTMPRWEGTAGELEDKLFENQRWATEAHRVLSFNTACGVYLSRLARKFPDRISKRRKHGKSTVWTIRFPPHFRGASLPEELEVAAEVSGCQAQPTFPFFDTA